MNMNMARSQRRKLPLAVMPTSSSGGHGYRDVRADAEVLQREGDADEFGDDGQEVEDEQVPDAEPAPEPAEPLVDQPGVPHPGDRAEPDHHLLVDDQHRDEQQQHPQQAVAVVLPGLRVGGHPARVVVADHHDQAGTGDREERHQAAGATRCGAPRRPGSAPARPRCHPGARHRARRWAAPASAARPAQAAPYAAACPCCGGTCFAGGCSFGRGASSGGGRVRGGCPADGRAARRSCSCSGPVTSHPRRARRVAGRFPCAASPRAGWPPARRPR